MTENKFILADIVNEIDTFYGLLTFTFLSTETLLKASANEDLTLNDDELLGYYQNSQLSLKNLSEIREKLAQINQNIIKGAIK